MQLYHAQSRPCFGTVRQRIWFQWVIFSRIFLFSRNENPFSWPTLNPARSTVGVLCSSAVRERLTIIVKYKKLLMVTNTLPLDPFANELNSHRFIHTYAVTNKARHLVDIHSRRTSETLLGSREVRTLSTQPPRQSSNCQKEAFAILHLSLVQESMPRWYCPSE